MKQTWKTLKQDAIWIKSEFQDLLRILNNRVQNNLIVLLQRCNEGIKCNVDFHCNGVGKQEYRSFSATAYGFSVTAFGVLCPVLFTPTTDSIEDNTDLLN